MSPDSPSGIRLSQEQIRFVELAIKEAIIEEVDQRLEAADAGREAALTERMAQIEAVAAKGQAGPAPSKALNGKLLGGAIGAAAVAAAVVALVLVPGRVRTAVEGQAAGISAMTTDLREAHATLGQQAAVADSLGGLIQAKADELQVTAGSQSFRSDIADLLKSDSEFLRLAAGPPGPRGPSGNAPDGVRFGPGVTYFEAGGVSLASMGRSGQGGGHAQVHNRSGSRVGYLGSSSQGDGIFRVSSSRDRAAVDLVAAQDSTSVTLMNGTALAYLATPRRGTAELTVGDRSGDGGVTLRSRDGLGSIAVNGRTAHDLAEVFDLAERDGVRAGRVMAATGPQGALGLSRGAYDRRVVGVISGAGGFRPGMVLGSRDDGSADLPVAINGQVFVDVSLEGGPIEPGDLLVASSTPGVAMKGTDPSRMMGAVIGKALEGFGPGDPDGLVKMLVMPR